MPRLLSPFIQSVFDNAALMDTRVYDTVFAMAITLTNGSPLNIAGATIVMSSISKGGASVSITPMTFEGRLEGVPDFRFEQDKAPDAGDCQGTNLDYVLTQMIPLAARVFDNAPTTCYLCFPKPDGTYEGLILFVGLVRNMAGEGEAATFTLISDLSDRSATFVEEITQKCVAELGDAWCGAQHLAPGATCSKILTDKVNGCEFYGQMHAYKAIHFIDPLGLVSGYGVIQTDTGGGWDEPPVDPFPGNQGCVDPHSYVKTPDGWPIAYTLKEGDPVQDHLGRIALVQKVERKHVQYRYLLTTTNGCELVCSADHPLLNFIDDLKGKQAYALNQERFEQDRFLVTVKGSVTELCEGWHLTPLEGGEVLNISLTEPHIYVAGRKKGFGIAGHNLKPIYGY